MLKHIELNPLSTTVLNNKQDELNDNLELLFKELKTEEETFTRLIDIQKHYNELAAKESNFKAFERGALP